MTNTHCIDQKTEAQRGQREHIWKATDQNLQAPIPGHVPIPDGFDHRLTLSQVDLLRLAIPGEVRKGAGGMTLNF